VDGSPPAPAMGLVSFSGTVTRLAGTLGTATFAYSVSDGNFKFPVANPIYLESMIRASLGPATAHPKSDGDSAATFGQYVHADGKKNVVTSTAQLYTNSPPGFMDSNIKTITSPK